MPLPTTTAKPVIPPPTPDPPPFPLAEELACYEANRPGWLGQHEGEFVLIKGPQVVGFFPDHESALEEGYRRFGVVPLLVKQILQVEPVYTLAHAEPRWHT
jgi:hypothetical protein